MEIEIIKRRLYENFIPVTEIGCWLWTGAMKPNGYGTMSVHNKTNHVHRLSWQVHYGKIPNGLFVLHKCDTRCCINPQHLFLGTSKDNVQDMLKKGRRVYAVGEKAMGGCLKTKDVIKIKQLIRAGFQQVDIAPIFDVSVYAINKINVGKTWKHIKLDVNGEWIGEDA